MYQVFGYRDYLKQLFIILKVVGIRIKLDVVVIKIFFYKLFFKIDSCESFISSEEEGEIQGEIQDKGVYKGKNGKFSKGYYEFRRKKKEKDRDSDKLKAEDSY